MNKKEIWNNTFTFLPYKEYWKCSCCNNDVNEFIILKPSYTLLENNGIIICQNCFLGEKEIPKMMVCKKCGKHDYTSICFSQDIYYKCSNCDRKWKD